MRKFLGPVAVVAMAAMGSVAWAQGTNPGGNVQMPADAVVAGRQAAFDLQAGVAGAMKQGVDSGADVKAYRDGAKGMAAWGRAIPGMFPDGTQNVHDTKARPEVWSDRAGFQKAAENFYAQADKLVAAAESGDKAAFAAQFQATGQACGACHRNYRQRTN